MSRRPDAQPREFSNAAGPENIAVPDTPNIVESGTLHRAPTLGDRLRNRELVKEQHQHRVTTTRMTLQALRESHAERLRAGLAVDRERTIVEEQKALSALRAAMLELSTTGDRSNREKRKEAIETLYDDHHATLERWKTKDWSPPTADRAIDYLMKELNQGEEAILRSMGAPID